MATYVPSTLITSKAFGNGAANIGTWRKQNTAGSSTFDIHRTTVAVSPSSSRTVTIEQGATAGDTVAQKLLDAYPLVANVQYVQNWWVTIQNNDYFEGFANAADVNGASYGYTYS